MLQQTRVEAVAPFFQRFLARFPDVAALAAAPLRDVLQLWSGLGYYRRARMLHAAAAMVVAERAGELPVDEDGWRELPGVGEYTAAAIASIAQGFATPVVDGNVKRVAARWLDLDAPADSRTLHKQARAWGGRLMAEFGGTAAAPARTANPAGDLNQALMELGATVCTPRAPRCEACPIATDCAARRRGTVENRPAPPARKQALVDLELAFLAAQHHDGWLLRERVEGWNPGLWEPPCLPAAGRAALQAAWLAQGGGGRVGAELGSVRHAITHHRIRARVFALQGWDGSGAVDPDKVALTGLARKVLTLARQAALAE